MQFNKSLFIIALLAIAIAVIGRIIPHPPNATPLAALAILSGYALRKSWAILITLLSLVISDAILSLFNHYSVFGSWSLFTYSGFLLMSYWAPTQGLKNVGIYTFFATVAYWLWTNLGSWMIGSLYGHTAQGLLGCYIAALPFLRNALIGTFIYVLIFWPSVKKLATYRNEHAASEIVN